MVADSNNKTEAAAEATKAQADAVAETAKAAADAGERTAATVRKAATNTARETSKTVAKNARKATRKTATQSRRKAQRSTAAPKPRANERNNEMKFDPTNVFAGFGAFPGASAFEKLFTEAAERGEEAAKRSRKAAEELADLYRGNIEAFVEAGRIAANGAQSIGQDFAAKSRDGIEQTANTVRSFAEAKSPTELLRLQSEFARSAFDRFVEDSSALTERVVKLAGEAFQPISNRTSANVERFNEIAA